MRMFLALIAVQAMGGTAFHDENGRTTLANPAIRYTIPEKPYEVLRRGEIEAVVVDHRSVDDGVIRGHRAGYSRNGYIGLFWASYIDRPESGAIHFRGHFEGGDPTPRWIESVSPAHGVRATHPSADDRRDFPHDEGFPLTLVFSRSGNRYDEPWYYGVSHGMAYAQIFRPRDQVRLAQSPSGGGRENPAWDFQAFIPDYEVGRRYTLVMRALFLPYDSAEQVRRAVEPHRLALERDTRAKGAK